mgnify:FL=1
MRTGQKMSEEQRRMLSDRMKIVRAAQRTARNSKPNPYPNPWSGGNLSPLLPPLGSTALLVPRQPCPQGVFCGRRRG